MGKRKPNEGDEMTYEILDPETARPFTAAQRRKHDQDQRPDPLREHQGIEVRVYCENFEESRSVDVGEIDRALRKIGMWVETGPDAPPVFRS